MRVSQRLAHANSFGDWRVFIWINCCKRPTRNGLCIRNLICNNVEQRAGLIQAIWADAPSTSGCTWGRAKQCRNKVFSHIKQELSCEREGATEISNSKLIGSILQLYQIITFVLLPGAFRSEYE